MSHDEFTTRTKYYWSLDQKLCGRWKRFNVYTTREKAYDARQVLCEIIERKLRMQGDVHDAKKLAKGRTRIIRFSVNVREQLDTARETRTASHSASTASHA